MESRAIHHGTAATESWAVGYKVARLADGGSMRVLDLFSGCGGMSLGFHSKGFHIVANVEIEKAAARSHALNFHRESEEAIEVHGRPRDITRIAPDELCAELSLGSVSTAVDVIIGGPPCQAYARVGRAKLRQVAEDPKAFRVDARRNLYLRYLDYVAAFQPLALVLENVPDILNQDGHNVVQEMVETLGILGYESRYSLLNAAHYGVPQMRDRLFMVAYRKELGVSISFPPATNRLDLPPGYASSRGHALKVVSAAPLVHPEFVHTAPGHSRLPAAVTSLEALGDLPFLAGKTITRQGQKLGEPSRNTYPSSPGLSSFATLMRNWKGFETASSVTDHVARRLPRDGRIFAAMKEGAEYPAAHDIAVRLFERAAARRGVAEGTAIYRVMRDEFVPPYDPSKFPNKWWKLRKDAPVRTLMAHLAKDCYTHIHYDRKQARTISVREAARLQSFPDGFRFAGSMNDAFRQIGNAVPPLMAAAIAQVIKSTLKQAAESWEDQNGRPAIAA